MDNPVDELNTETLVLSPAAPKNPTLSSPAQFLDSSVEVRLCYIYLVGGSVNSLPAGWSGGWVHTTLVGDDEETAATLSCVMGIF